MKHIVYILLCLGATAGLALAQASSAAKAVDAGAVAQVAAKVKDLGGEYFTAAKFKWSFKTAEQFLAQPPHGFSFTGPNLKEQVQAFAALKVNFPFRLNLYTAKESDAVGVVALLAGLDQLQSLRLHGPLAADVYLPALARCKNLKILELGCTPYMTGPGLKHLAALQGLQGLRLYQCFKVKYTADNLAELGSLHNLQVLEILYSSKVTDAGLSALTPLKNLRVLYLDRAEVTDAGLRVLAGLSQLQEVGLPNANAVTAQGLGELRQVLPGAQIHN
jgi:hypothetical protein